MNDCEYIIMDWPPTSDSPVAQNALMIADLALVPIVSSSLNIWASIGIKEGIKDASDMDKYMKSRLVANR